MVKETDLDLMISNDGYGFIRVDHLLSDRGEHETTETEGENVCENVLGSGIDENEES